MGHKQPPIMPYPSERTLCEMDYICDMVVRRGKEIIYKDGKPGIMTPWCMSSDCEYGSDMRFRPITDEELAYIELDREFPGVRG